MTSGDLEEAFDCRIGQIVAVHRRKEAKAPQAQLSESLFRGIGCVGGGRVNHAETDQAVPKAGHRIPHRLGISGHACDHDGPADTVMVEFFDPAGGQFGGRPGIVPTQDPDDRRGGFGRRFAVALHSQAPEEAPREKSGSESQRSEVKFQESSKRSSNSTRQTVCHSIDVGEIGNDLAGVVDRTVIKAGPSEGFHVARLQSLGMAGQLGCVGDQSRVRFRKLCIERISLELLDELFLNFESTEPRSVMLHSVVAAVEG